MAKGGEFILPTDKLTDHIFTVKDFTEEHSMIRQTMREFVADNILKEEVVRNLESKDWGLGRRLLVELAQLGVLGAEVPEEYGGQGLDKISGAIIAEEVGRQGSFACTFLAHTGIGTLPIRFFGTPDQKSKYLPKLVSGEWVSCYSLTESSAGSDANGVKATAVKNDDGSYVLNGEKILVTNGGFADVYIIFAQLEGSGLTAFIVEKTFPGLSIGKEEHKMGIQGSSTATIILNNVLVPSENLLGEPGKGFKIAINILNLGRFKLGAASLGGGKLVLNQSLEYSKQRKQFGINIFSFGAIKTKLAQMAARVYAMEAIVYRTAGYLEEAISNVDSNDSRAILKAIEEFAIECSLVKVSCSEALNFIVDENVQIHGGYGFCEGGAERFYRDSRINRIFEGTNEVNRLVITGILLKKAIKGDLPLMPVIKKIVGESMTPAIQMEPSDLRERLFYYLNNAKKTVLLAAGIAYEKFGFKLEEHQAVLMALSDCLINIYVIESCLSACSRANNSNDLNLVRFVFNDSLFEIEKTVRELISMCSAGDGQRTHLAMVRRLMKFTPENKEQLANEIVESIQGA